MSLKTPGGERVHHVLKTLPQYYDAVDAGTKTFEVRINDRGFQTGEVIELVRMRDASDHNADGFDRPRLCKRITYIFSGDPRLGSLSFGGVQPGYVVLALGDVE